MSASRRASGSPFRSPLFWRLLIWFCAANLLVLVLGSLLTRRFSEYFTAQEADWPALAQAADQAYESGGSSGLRDWARQQRPDGIDATLFEQGHALSDMHLPQWIRASLPVWLGEGHDIVLKPHTGYVVAVQQVLGKDGRPRQLVATSSARARLPPHARQKMFLEIQLALSLLLIGLVGWWVARGVARPVEALRDATRRMAAGEFSTRVGRRWNAKHDELGQLARDFNGMAERIETLVMHDRVVLQDLSHELRSPLARLHLILDLAQHSADASEAAQHFQHAEREIARLDRMTSEMLALSRLEAGLPGMDRDLLDLAELLVDRVQAAGVEAEARGIRISLPDIASPIIVNGSALLLERALDNLVANAIKFSPAHGVIDIRLKAQAGFAELSMRDHGPGVPEAELEQMFRPFFRGSNAARADGHGLGLAIVQRVVQAHGGSAHAENGIDGGLEVYLCLPLASAQQAG